MGLLKRLQWHYIIILRTGKEEELSNCLKLSSVDFQSHKIEYKDLLYVRIKANKYKEHAKTTKMLFCNI